jgi:histidinol-phosphate aminotransferase
MEPDITSLLRPSVKGLAPYRVERGGSRLKMDANESPYSWPPELLEEVVAELRGVELNRYPDPSAEGLRGILSEQLGVRPERIVLGNGSDELIQYLLLAFGGPEVKVLSPVPTFPMYEIVALATGCRFVGVPLDPGFDLDLEAMRAAIDREAPRLLFLAYPNNPTGNCFRREFIVALLREFEGLVMIDEAYFHFSRKSFIDLLDQHQNLLILRSLSKIGLAGLRVGFLVGGERIIEAVCRVRLPYNVNTFSQVAARIILSRDEFVRRQVEILVAERERLFRELQSRAGIHPFPSEANFILFRAPKAETIFEGLRSRGILVRSFDGSGPLRDHLRVTVGKPEENDLFLEAMDALIEEGGVV